MTELNRWLQQATRHLSSDSAAQVRTEIQAHFESGRDAAITQGATAEEADRLALTALGDARTANRQYRKVLLTSAEARMLRDGNREAHAICSRRWLKQILLAVPIVAVLAGCASLFAGAVAIADVLLPGGLALGIFFAAPFLPIYTPLRARVYRVAKWLALPGALWLTLGPEALKYSLLFASCLWIPLWTELTRYSIRRKLPIAEWPKQLYL